MRFFLLAFVLLFTLTKGYAQQNDPLDHPVSIHFKNITIKKALKEISKKYHLEFSYSSNVVPVEDMISIDEDEVLLRTALDHFFAVKHIGYKYLNGKIVLVMRSPAEEQHEIIGRVTDASTGQTIPGAIVILDSVKTAITSYDGSFLFAQTDGSHHQLVFRMLGYKTLVLNSTDLSPEIKMEPAPIKLGEAIKVADAIIDRTTVSDVVLSREELEINKGFSSDPLLTVTSLPGISSKGNLYGSSQIFVKGGDANEALYYLDNAPVYWPWYFMGKSVFNIETIEKAEVLTGGFPATYGNSMSAIFNMKSKDGSMNTYGASASAGFYDFQVTAEGPLVKDKVSLLVSARRSYLDLIFNNSDTIKIPSFSDLTFKLVWQLNSKNKLSVSGLNAWQYYLFNRDSADFGEARNINFNGNINTKSIQWQSTLSDKWYSKLSLTYSSLQSQIAVDRNYDTRAGGKSFGIREDVTHFINAKHKVKAGYEGYYADVHVSGHSPLDPVNENPSDSSVKLMNLNTNESIYTTGGYFLYEGYVFEVLKVNSGVRADYQFIDQNIDLSPRLSLGYHLSKRLELRAATGFYYQPADVIGASKNPDLTSNKSIHYTGGISYELKHEITGWVEGFYKDYSNLVVYDSLLNYSNDGYGNAKGIALILKKESEKLSGWISYTYSISKRKSSLQKEVNYFFYDQPHLLNAVVNYSFIDKKRKIIPSSLTLNYSFISGTPYTPVEGASVIGGIWTPVYGKTLSERNRSFSNLNIKLEWHSRFGKTKKSGISYYVQLWNILGITHFEKRVYEYGAQYQNGINELVSQNQNLLFSIGFRIDFNRPLN